MKKFLILLLFAFSCSTTAPVKPTFPGPSTVLTMVKSGSIKDCPDLVKPTIKGYLQGGWTLEDEARNMFIMSRTYVRGSEVESIHLVAANKLLDVKAEYLGVCASGPLNGLAYFFKEKVPVGIYLEQKKMRDESKKQGI